MTDLAERSRLIRERHRARLAAWAAGENGTSQVYVGVPVRHALQLDQRSAAHRDVAVYRADRAY